MKLPKLPKFLRVEVTQEDIDKAQLDNGHYCPIAMAIRRQFNLGGYDDVEVSYVDGIRIVVEPYGIVWLNTTERARRMIVQSDTHKHINPAVFRFPVDLDWTDENIAVPWLQ